MKTHDPEKTPTPRRKGRKEYAWKESQVQSMATILAAKVHNTGAKERNNSDRKRKQKRMAPAKASAANEQTRRKRKTKPKLGNGRTVCPRHKTTQKQNVRQQRQCKASHKSAEGRSQKQAAHLNHHHNHTAREESVTKQNQRKNKRPNPALNYQQALLGTERKERPPAKSPKEYQLHGQNHQGCRRRAEQLDRKTQGQEERDPPKEGRTRRNRTTTPQTQASTSAKGRDPCKADHRDKERQEDKVTKSRRLHPQGSPTTMELQRSAQKTATNHPAPPQRVQEEQSQQTLSQHQARAPAAVQTV